MGGRLLRLELCAVWVSEGSQISKNGRRTLSLLIARLTHSLVCVSVVASHLRTQGSNQAEKSISSGSLWAEDVNCACKGGLAVYSLWQEGLVHVFELSHAMIKLEKVGVGRLAVLLSCGGVERRAGTVEVVDELRCRDGEKESRWVDLAGHRRVIRTGNGEQAGKVLTRRASLERLGRIP